MVFGSLLLLAGPNGAGKSTLANSMDLGRLLDGYRKLNADDRTLELIQAAGFAGFRDTPEALLKDYFITAANETFQTALNELRVDRNVCLETVLSTNKYCQLVSQVRQAGGKFDLLYVALNTWSISAQRVAARVIKGGHSVPLERLEGRWRRSLEFLPWFASRSDLLMVFDNSDSVAGTAPELVPSGTSGLLSWRMDKGQVFPELRSALSGVFPVETEPTILEE